MHDGINCEKTFVCFDENGIDERRILNKDDFTLSNFICCICNNLANNPMNCISCEEMFCNKCISDWKNNRGLCPLKCTNTEINKINQTLNRKFEEIILSCRYSPKCNYSATYWDIFYHDNNCDYKKEYEIEMKKKKEKVILIEKIDINEENYKKMKLDDFHFHNEVSFLTCHCCYKINEELQLQFLDMSAIERFELYDTIINNNNRMVRCLCKKTFCVDCISKRKNAECVSSCYLFQSGYNSLNDIYNISKYELPKNWEAKIYFDKVDWVRTGITFDKQITLSGVDNNSPPFDVSYILEDLYQIYHERGWKNQYTKGKPLAKGDTLTLTMIDNHLRYSQNGISLGRPIEMKSNKVASLLVHRRNKKTDANLLSIVEIVGISKLLTL